MKPIPSLMLVTNKGDAPWAPYLDFIEACAASGLSAVQLREKNMDQMTLLKFGRAIKKILAPFNTTFIVNDNIKLCMALDADGVHLGQQDESAKRARKILGHEKLIGLSINTEQEACHANTLPINYIGVGAIFPTQNKANVATIWGIAGLAKVKALSHHPIIAIGGIDESNAATIAATGVHGMAAIAAFQTSTNPSLTTQHLLHLFTGRTHA